MRAIVLVVMLAACSNDPVPPPSVPAPIEIAARPRPEPAPLVFPGAITSRVSSTILAERAGTYHVLVADGDIVEAGEILATFSEPRPKSKKRILEKTIVAPYAGVISSIDAKAERGMPLLRIASTKRVQLRFAVQHPANIAKGTKVVARIDGRAAPVTAVVRSVGPSTEAPIQLAIVEADLSIRDTSGLLGSIADVTLAN